MAATAHAMRRILVDNARRKRAAAFDPPKAGLVKLGYFVGMTIEEAAEALGISKATAKRHWDYAMAWLYGETASLFFRTPDFFLKSVRLSLPKFRL